MSTAEVKNSNYRYKQYPNFEKYYKDLKKIVEEQRVQSQEDDLVTAMQLLSFPKDHLNKREYSYWDGNPAYTLFEVDCTKGRHKTQTYPNFARVGWNTQSSLLQCFGSESIEKIPSKSQQHFGGTSATR